MQVNHYINRNNIENKVKMNKINYLNNWINGMNKLFQRKKHLHLNKLNKMIINYWKMNLLMMVDHKLIKQY